jgi:O-antigen/teichoic acid export membrane protein
MAARRGPARRRRATGSVRLIHGCLVAVLVLLGLFRSQFLESESDAEALIYAACLAFVALSIWSIWSWKAATGRLFDPYVLFLMSAMLFNGGLTFLEVFDLNERGILDGKFSSQTTLEAIFLGTLGLAANDSRADPCSPSRRRRRARSRS